MIAARDQRRIEQPAKPGEIVQRIARGEMSIHVCKCIHNGREEHHLRYPGMTEAAAQELADQINSGALTEVARLRAEVEALREDAAKCRAELLAIHEIASCGWSNVLQHPIAPADTLTVRDVKIMAIELLKGHQTAEPRVHG